MLDFSLHCPAALAFVVICEEIYFHIVQHQTGTLYDLKIICINETCIKALNVVKKESYKVSQYIKWVETNLYNWHTTLFLKNPRSLMNIHLRHIFQHMGLCTLVSVYHYKGHKTFSNPTPETKYCI